MTKREFGGMYSKRVWVPYGWKFKGGDLSGVS